MPDRKYPGAYTGQWLQRAHGGVRMDRLRKIVLHSTEGAGWPGYPSFAPHITIDVFDKMIRQHMDIDISATTLSDPDSTPVRENRDGVVQIEIVMSCDPDNKDWRKHVTKMGEDEYAYLAQLLKWLNTEWGIPLVSTVRWVEYPDSFGPRAAQRLSSSRYDDYEGILGHQHVSGNAHGDPGKINIKKLLELAQPGPIHPPQQPKGFDMASAETIYFKRNTDQKFEKAEQNQLRVDDEGTLSVVVGENAGVDILGNIAFKTNDGKPAKVFAWWGLVDGGEKEEKILANRLGVSMEAAEGHVQTTFKGKIPKPSGAGRSMRLRLYFRMSAPGVVTAVQVTGWKM